MQDFFDTWRPRALAALRIVTALLFIPHGSAKLLGWPQVEMFADLQLFSLIGLAGVLELVGGLLILVGWFTRPVAFVLSGFMAAAYFMAHAGEALLPLQNGGELAALYSWLFLYLAVAGAGAWSIDALTSAEPRHARVYQ